MTTFDDWALSFGIETTDDEALARAAWEAATKEALRRIQETSKRYTCDKMLGVCKAIIYELQRVEK